MVFGGSIYIGEIEACKAGLQGVVVWHASHTGFIGGQTHQAKCAWSRTRAITLGVALNFQEHLVPTKSSFVAVVRNAISAYYGIIIFFLTGRDKNPGK